MQRVATHHIGVALIEFAVASFLRTVGTPYGLYLEALEGHLQVGTVLHHEAGEGYSQVVAQTLFTQLRGEAREVARFKVFGIYGFHEVAGVEYLEEELIPLFAVFTHEGGEVFERGGLNLFVAEEAECLADGIEYIVAAGHLYG